MFQKIEITKEVSEIKFPPNKLRSLSQPRELDVSNVAYERIGRSRGNTNHYTLSYSLCMCFGFGFGFGFVFLNEDDVK